MATDSGFGVHCERRADAVVVVVRGELDLDSADALRDVLLGQEAQATTVVLDLRAVSFIDSSGLSVVVGAHHHAGAAGRRFVVSLGGAPAVQRLFDLTGLAEVISMTQDPDEALS